MYISPVQCANRTVAECWRASATGTVDPGSISGWVKLETIKISIHSFPG